ncbi:MAG: LysM peptidoglycan-binding domain-containing protein [Nitrospinota bacterium]|nr:LysM peptidoglycan-binding domain-containing protein [Nitrospinota bacterium]
MLQYFKRSAFVLFVALFVLLSFSSFSHSHPRLNPFKTPNGLESKVNFWINVYTKYTTDQVIIHDADNLDIIYEVVDFTGQKHLSKRAKNKKVKRVKKFYKSALQKLARKNKNTKMGTSERKLYSMVKKSFWNASKNIRAQLGQKDRFQEGLRRSGYYINEMRRIFKEFGLPQDLTALPHVESSFQIGAYSKSGAVGIWQFMRSTGKRFMTINYAVDERRDPIKATIAAAKLLKGNYEELGNWPLAITAYNHGLNGMKRAKKKLRSNDIVDVINDYKSRRFGFASENFYAGFLAALEASKNHEKYFPGINFYRPRHYDSYKLPEYVNIKTLSKYFNLDEKKIKRYNPSLRRPVLKAEQYVPAGFVFHVPKNHVQNLRIAYSRIPEKEKFSSQKRTRWYRVHRGDTLGRIAKRFGTSVRALKQRNQLPRSGIIYVGQVLQLPGKGRAMTASSQKRKTVRQQKSRDKVFSGNYKKIVVRKNDTLDIISSKHDVSIKTILKENYIKNRNIIYPGQVLQIPEMAGKKDKIEMAKLENPKKDNSTRLEKSSVNKIELAEAKTETVVDKGQETSNHLLPVSVRKDPDSNNLTGVIFVEVDETLGHYAEWSRISAQLIRKTNGFRYGRFIRLNQKIKIPFSRVTPDVFFQKRSEYHKSVQEDFFENYKVKETIEYTVKSGITVWEICNEIYDIPLWLLRRYNPKTDLEFLKKGEKLTIPIVT